MHFTQFTHSKRQRPAAAGFTLLEIMIAVAIIVMVSTAAIYGGATMMRRGRVASVVTAVQQAKASIADYLSDPNTQGSLPLTTDQMTTANFTGTGTTVANVAAAASLDQVFLAEGITDKPFAVSMGSQITTPSGTVGVNWSTTLKKFTATAAPNVDKSNIARLECGQAVVAFDPPGNFQPDGLNFLTAGKNIVYMEIPGVPIKDAQALSLAIDKASLSVSNPADDDLVGSVCYTGAGATGTTTVWILIGSF